MLVLYFYACKINTGVYFEKILKNSTTSLWMRNVQMGISSIILGFMGVFLSTDRDIVLQKGFFYGYNWIVITVILLQVFAKYA
jgi:UDP-sugar transporter A1/2/3